VHYNGRVMFGTKVQHKKDSGETLCLDSSGPSPSLSCDEYQHVQVRRRQCLINAALIRRH
jgi:hypothetical protein